MHTFVVICSEVWLDEFPHIFKINEEEVQEKFVLSPNHFVSHCVSIITETDLFVRWVYFVDKGEVEDLPAKLSQSFIIRFDIHFVLLQQSIQNLILIYSFYQQSITFYSQASANPYIVIGMSQQQNIANMKNSLRKAAGSKSYAQPQQGDINMYSNKEREKDGQKESIFEHKNWSVKQKVKLMIFLNYYQALPDWNSERRSIHLYKHLSTFLKKTRTPEQCKNIHSLLKRKFSTLEEVISAMQNQLIDQENYEKCVSKYEKEIEKFQNQYQLFLAISDDKKGSIEALKPRRISERDENQQMQKQHDSENLKINLNEYVKRQQIQFDKLSNQLALQSQFYFKQWLKCVSIIEYKNKMQER